VVLLRVKQPEHRHRLLLTQATGGRQRRVGQLVRVD
jgi:hypothetical protein